MALYRKRSSLARAYQTQEKVTIATIEGDVVAQPGDWIVTDEHGTRVFQSATFTKTYEPVAA